MNNSSGFFTKELMESIAKYNVSYKYSLSNGQTMTGLILIVGEEFIALGEIVCNAPKVRAVIALNHIISIEARESTDIMKKSIGFNNQDILRYKENK